MGEVRRLRGVILEGEEIGRRSRPTRDVSRLESTMQCIVDTLKCVTMHCDTLVDVHNALTCRQALMHIF